MLLTNIACTVLQRTASLETTSVTRTNTWPGSRKGVATGSSQSSDQAMSSFGTAGPRTPPPRRQLATTALRCVSCMLHWRNPHWTSFDLRLPPSRHLLQACTRHLRGTAQEEAIRFRERVLHCMWRPIDPAGGHRSIETATHSRTTQSLSPTRGTKILPATSYSRTVDQNCPRRHSRLPG
jgi:hypothetical protein